MDTENYITIRSYKDQIMADIIIAALHNAEIPTFSLINNNTMFPASNVEIKVRAEDVEYALEIIDQQENV